MPGLPLLLSLSLAPDPAATRPGTEGVPPPSRSAQQTYHFVAASTEAERRHRFVLGSLKTTLGTFDVGIGLYTLLALRDAGPTVTRSATIDMVAGGGLVLDGVLQLARRGPLETLMRDPAYLRLRSPDATAQDLAAFERRFAALARRGRTERLVAGSLSIAGGVVIGILGGLLLFDPDVVDAPEGETILGGSMIGSSLGFLSVGVQGIALPSPAERALAAWRALEDPTATRLRVGLGPGGVALHGRF